MFEVTLKVEMVFLVVIHRYGIATYTVKNSGKNPKFWGYFKTIPLFFHLGLRTLYLYKDIEYMQMIHDLFIKNKDNFVDT